MKYILFVLAGACSYGLLATFVKKAYESGFHVGDVVGSQSLFGVVMLWILVFVTKRTSRQSAALQTVKVTKSQALILMAVGTTIGLTGIFYYTALQYISASFATILLFQFTWLGILLEAIVERKLPGKSIIISLIILFIGIILASGYLGGSKEAVSWLGITLGLLSAVTYTLFIWFSGKTVKQISPITRSAITLSGSFVLIMLLFPPRFLINGALHEALLPWALLLALFGIVIPPLFYAIGVPRIGGGLATILSAAELPMAVIMSYLVLNEAVNWLQWLGVGITMFGIALPDIMKRWNSRSPNVDAL
ncbi:drug/metabolite transporter (DMT)-like permease [Paenibacillus sp. V4I3]|uniref:EamA family transporter n=1 Tax=Paenibacillus sp. V4I3 TaxID=3042305 RepID=UPI002781D42D|nr:DMT family transporter [Paenibacillus sp. V4I3]MDQ0874291.1 drug/metabolite transporter (DMT)-like permease [Paenibacillus sp. V4I3]